MQMKYPEEIQYLDMVRTQLAASLAEYEEAVANYENDYLESKKYLASYWNELDPMERFSNQCSISRIENAGNHTLDMRNRTRRLMGSPYFARIDFCFDGEEEAEAIYIGPFAFRDGKSRILVYDWRAPISNMYYEYELGPAGYEAPSGIMAGQLTRKRQIKVENGELAYVLENVMNINDDILGKELSETADKKMKTIIATIQREQNQIIRNNRAQCLVIQGVPGSGKTSIALHRVAYLLYRNKDSLLAADVAIISPNKVFADYIAGVLPELGEEPIQALSFEMIAEEELAKGPGFERYAVHAEDYSPEWLEKLKLKGTLEFVRLMDDYLAEAEERYFAAEACTFGSFRIERDFIVKRYQAHRGVPVFQRFEEIAVDILERLKSDRLVDGRMLAKGEVVKKLRAMYQIKDTLALYAEFYQHIRKTEQFQLKADNTLEWPDVFPYLYMKLYMEGAVGEYSVQHLVIDEMQDYSPIQYAVINRLFPCKKTILGDCGQSLLPYHHGSEAVFRQLFGNMEFVRINKSYRSTWEIAVFAARIMPDQQIEAVERHGQVPQIISCEDCDGELAAIRAAAAAFGKSSYATMGIICKNSQQAEYLCRELEKTEVINCLNFDSTRFENGIHITTIPLSKGLEFDEVLVPFAGDEVYNQEYDRNLLYIACTRAMHKLTVTNCGKLTSFLEGQGIAAAEM